MTELKPGWKRVKFGDVVRLSKARSVNPEADGIERYVGLEHIDPDDLQIRRWGLVAEGTTFTTRFKPGQVLFGKRRAYQRKVAVADFEGICSGDIYVFESANPNLLLPKLLPFICQTNHFFEYAVSTSVGSISPRTNWRSLASFEFNLPSLNEQRIIAQALLAAELTSDSYHLLTLETKQLWQATAVELFSPNRVISNYKPHKEVTLGELLEYASDGPFGSKLKTEHYTEKGVRVIRLQNIEELLFNGIDEAFIDEEYYREELVRYTVKPNDVLIAGLGDERIRAGRSCLAPKELGPAINKADCFCLRTVKDLQHEFLVHFLNSSYGLRQARKFAQGTTRIRLNLENIKRWRIPLPPLRVQQEIVNSLRTIHQSEKAAKNRKECQLAFKKNLLSMFG